ncbi:polyphenol oxidase family protein [Patescibacteria group bacterium]|nr:polyphenol oxidase family protein [Patescibacteria group bacterium]
MKLKHNSNADKSVQENRKKFLNKNQIQINDLIAAKLAHRNNIKNVFKEDKGRCIENSDELITTEKNIYLTFTVADCFPVFLFDPVNNIIGLMHIGWGGASKGIIENIIKLILYYTRNNISNLLVEIGPGLQVCHFEVKNDLVVVFKEFPNQIINKNNKKYLNLSQIIKNKFNRAGVAVKNVEVDGDCTYCKKSEYFSYRRNKSRKLKTMMAFIGINK